MLNCFLINQYKTCDSLGGPFWPQGYYLNELGRCTIDYATYQISKLYALWLFEINLAMLLMVLLINLHKICVPKSGSFLPRGHNLKQKLVEVN